MSEELKPCPFCGGNANAEPGAQHTPNCYFEALDRLKAAPKADLSLVPEVLRAWNRRAQQAPVQDEPDMVVRVCVQTNEVMHLEEVATSEWIDSLPHGTEVELHRRPAQTAPQESEHHAQLLGQALGECIAAAGIIRPEVSLSGPELLMFADDLKRHLTERPEQSGLIPEGYALVPITPTEAQWSGLARDLMMWLDMSDKTAQGLFKHLRMLGVEPPQWLRDEPEMQGAGVPSKGTRVTLIYRAMIEDYRAAVSVQRGEA